MDVLNKCSYLLMKVVWVSAQMKYGEQSTAGTSVGNTSFFAVLQSVLYGSDDKILDGIWKSSFCVNSYAFWCKFLDYFLWQRADGVLVPGGFGDRGIQGKILAASYARTNAIPYLGICLGMQIAVVEFARNVR